MGNLTSSEDQSVPRSYPTHISLEALFRISVL